MPTVRIDNARWKKLEILAVEETIRRNKPISANDVLRQLIDYTTKNNEKNIKLINKPEQKGSWEDYWIAVCDGEVADGDTEQSARQNLLNKLKDMN
ncbi:hypothetical protein L4D04_00020 [Photobacterium angustum]|uniref:hypothetical protein n=1 Tax=Photobacterium angustum TaxID=661 RepID=UPI003D0D013F